MPPATMRPIRLGLIGIGKIARDQHLPAIAADPRFDLVATASADGGGAAGVPGYRDLAALLDAHDDLDAVSICTPPGARHAVAAAAIEAGLHVMLEKPPATWVQEVEHLVKIAEMHGRSLFATWHSREAFGVVGARAWLAERRIDAVRIVWREDIRRWHPGQEWILEAGGFGVFDPAINALSIVTAILPDPLVVETATLYIPDGRAAPIAAMLAMRSGAAPVSADLDFRQTGPQTWDIAVDTDRGTLTLAMGGSILQLPGEPERRGPNAEYPRLYARFADLIATHASDVDTAPLRLVSDALGIGGRETADAFAF